MVGESITCCLWLRAHLDGSVSAGGSGERGRGGSGRCGLARAWWRGDGSAPGRVMFGASAASRSLTFSSFAASFSSLAASHCRRSSLSCHTARQRPPSSRAGYNGDAARQFDDLTAAARGGTPCSVRQDLVARRSTCPGPAGGARKLARGRLWGFCEGLQDHEERLGHGDHSFLRFRRQ
jgi:hypothetical protein